MADGFTDAGSTREERNREKDWAERRSKHDNWEARQTPEWARGLTFSETLNHLAQNLQISMDN